MIIAVEKVRRLVQTDIADDALRTRLRGIEAAIRKYTNNHFIVRGTERVCEIRRGKIIIPSSFFLIGDTIEILGMDEYKDEVYSITNVHQDLIEVEEPLRFEGKAMIALVQYPDEVKLGAVNLLKWDISNREKIGVKSESISRWSVTYYDLESNSILGYPSSLLGFLKNYMRARF